MASTTLLGRGYAATFEHHCFSGLARSGIDFNLPRSADMPPVRCAVIDIGTNSVKLLVADIQGQSVVPAFETSKQTRLGEDFYSTHRLQPVPISRTVEAVASFG